MGNDSTPIADAAQRAEALNPERSFIVQAPAGSGKTELLIQRYLKLLAMVAAPEEVIAITFTRKAAAEMRGRVLSALHLAKAGVPPDTDHARTTRDLAKAVLDRNDRLGWEVENNPIRLKIQTIDSLCASLTRQMPFLSEFGAQPDIAERPEELYREAARHTVADLESGFRWSPAMEAMVQHLDNDLTGVEALVARMLAKRDQWLRHMVGTGDAGLQRKILEQALADFIKESLADVRDNFPGPGLDILLSSARYAARNLRKEGMDSPIRACEDLDALPGAELEEIEKWLGLRELLLTKEGGWRKSATINIGFPPPSSAKGNPALKQERQMAKDEFLAYIGSAAGEDRAAALLDRVRDLPDAVYTDDQWRILSALFEILKVAAGHLKLVFQRSGTVDFAEIGLRAAKALGDPEMPTDLSLFLDYRIRHILMDEFQDTSFTQYELIERLTAGWTPGDGRTFFAVGDPMQSIYGFREAEVGLFLNARTNGLAQVPLIPLTLSVNFRSQKGIIDWVNQSFPNIMPSPTDFSNDVTLGRVSYAPSTAFHPSLSGLAVRIHPFLPMDPAAEAQAVVRCVQQAKSMVPSGTVAVLVRGRSHLARIVPALKEAGIRFQAVEIDALTHRPVISDLIALSRALSHPADRIAWLAVLRAPWCGMTLNDLYALSGDAPDNTILELMARPEILSRMTADGFQRLCRIREILVPAIENRCRNPFRQVVEGAWIRLGGPACVFEPSALADAADFFDLLEAQAGHEMLTDFAALEDAVKGLYARPDVLADDTVQIMTIHKAKGLEFDTVILPGLDHRPPPDPPQLLLWLERATARQKDLLLAPISETGTDKNKIYAGIEKIHDEKKAWEDTRLLYVAVTRARKFLHIMGGVNLSKEAREILEPGGKTLLRSLWPAVSPVFYQKQAVQMKGNPPGPENAANQKEEPIMIPFIRRLANDWHLPELPADVRWHSETESPSEEIRGTPEFDWAGETARLAGVVAHAWLRKISEQGIGRWNADRVERLAPVLASDLVQSGVGSADLAAAVRQVAAALKNALSDEKGRWILSPHRESACEYALTGVVGGKIISVKMDRTFVDENNVRWIIDYKTGVHAGGAVEEFLDREKLRYQDQLEFYKRLMAVKDTGEIRLGLYFPMLRGWREWR